MPPPRGLFQAAIVAGLVAGATAAVFHLVVTEPLIDRAIQHEEQIRRAHGQAVAVPIVSRMTQKTGLVAGFLAYGAIWGGLVGVAARLLERRLPALTPAGRGVLVAALGGWSVSLFPFLKYPANPPGVGDPQTIGYRQALYLAFVALSVVSITLAVALAARLRARGITLGRSRPSWPLAAAMYGPCAAVLYVAMPASPDTIRMPGDLVSGFRLASLAGLVLFWTVLGAVFGWRAQERMHG